MADNLTYGVDQLVDEYRRAAHEPAQILALMETQAVTQYVQRVWDSNLNEWCYYTKTTIDPSPAATETSPNHTGSISNHQIVRSRVIQGSP